MIRFAIVGAGLIGRERLTALQKLAARGRPVSLVGIFDADPERCQAVAKEFGTRAFRSLEELLETRPEWVGVALPHDIAVSVARQILKRELRSYSRSQWHATSGKPASCSPKGADD